LGAELTVIFQALGVRRVLAPHRLRSLVKQIFQCNGIMSA
jgi:hypothetical protein